MKSLIGSLSSVKLAIVLIIIITLASILGTLIPQLRTAAEYAAHYGSLSKIMIMLELTDLYHSWWFNGLLSLFALNVIVCTLTRLSPKLKKTFRPSLRFETKSLLSLKINDRVKKNWDLDRCGEELQRLLRSRRFRIKESKQEGAAHFLAQKKRAGLFGSDIVHLGLLIILIGGIISGMGGFRDNLTISEGQTLSVPEADFQIRLNKFDTEYYASGAVKDWKSDLTVIDKSGPVLSKIIEVNHPLSYNGFVFYQSRYGWNWENPSLEIWVKKREDPSFLKRAELRLGGTAKLEEDNMEFTAVHFVPDFIINENNEPVTRSLEPNNPAAFIEGTQDGEKVFSGWIFANFPDFARIHSDVETDLIFELKSFRGSPYSGLQVAKDPGVNFIWAGCIFLMIGLSVAFYWPPSEMKFIIEERQGKTEIIAGGIAKKFKDAFQSEFDRIISSLRSTK
jgi:cytochrome c biogenesis protein